jgi:hypothetical protein
VLPNEFVGRLNPGMELMFRFQQRCRQLINSVIKNQNNDEEEKVKFSHPTFFHEVLSSNLPAEEKSAERLAQDIQVVIGAGGETVAKALGWITYYLLKTPQTLEKLKKELNKTDQDQEASLASLEQMPYLVNVLFTLDSRRSLLCFELIILRLQLCLKVPDTHYHANICSPLIVFFYLDCHIGSALDWPESLQTALYNPTNGLFQHRCDLVRNKNLKLGTT